MKTMTRMPGSTADANSPPSPSQYIGSMMLGRAITVVVVMAHKIPASPVEAAAPGRPPAIGSAMTTHKAVHVASAQAPLTLVDVETTPPGPGHVRIAVAACGVCGTDHAFRHRWLPEHDVAADAGARDRGNGRRTRRRCRGLRGRRPGCRRLVRRQLQPVHPLSQGAVHAVRVRAGAELALSGWLRRIGDRPRPPRSPASPTNCHSPKRRRWAAQG